MPSKNVCACWRGNQSAREPAEDTSYCYRYEGPSRKTTRPRVGFGAKSHMFSATLNLSGSNRHRRQATHLSLVRAPRTPPLCRNPSTGAVENASPPARHVIATMVAAATLFEILLLLAPPHVARVAARRADEPSPSPLTTANGASRRAAGPASMSCIVDVS